MISSAVKRFAIVLFANKSPKKRKETTAQTARASSSSTFSAFRRRASSPASSPIVQAGGAPRRSVENSLQIGRGPGGGLEQRLGGGSAETVAVGGGEAQGDGPVA